VTLERPAPIDLVVDTSAIMAIALNEQLASAVQSALESVRGPVISSATIVELSIVAASRVGPDGRAAVRAILETSGVVTMPVDDLQADLAIDAWLRFGKGNHPARLNYGDCFSYALAHHLEVPVLCVGNDFARTDLELMDVARTS
jgi:ribonuclease VapC